MRLWSILIVLSILILSCLSTVSAETDVRIENKHITITLPAGWNYERNVTNDGDFYDLEFASPARGLVPAQGTLLTDAWTKAVNNLTLYVEMQATISYVKNSPVFTSVTIISAPQNRTINGMMAIDATIHTITTESIDMRERVVIMASNGWNLAWAVVFATLDSEYSLYGSDINSIIDSMIVDAEPGNPLQNMSGAILIGGIAGATAIAIIVAVIIRNSRKKKSQEAQQMQYNQLQPIQYSQYTQPQSPPPIMPIAEAPSTPPVAPSETQKPEQKQ